MSTVLSVALPWGLYHATPWDRSANEGAVEWPPSPWRVLRALYSSWKVHHPDLFESDVISVLSALSGSPTYVVPAHTATHTRHYLPGIGHLDGVKTDTDKTLDAVVVTDRDARLWIEWESDLSPGQHETLRTLASGVRYLGRAESIVDVEVAEHAGTGTVLQPGADLDGHPTVRLLAPRRPLDLEALITTPTQVRKSRHLLPPATEWVTYRRPDEADRIISRLQHRSQHAPPTGVRFALSGSVLPSRFDAVLVGHVLRAAAMSRFEGRSSVLSGRDPESRPLRTQHSHAHYLSLTTDRSPRRISDVVVWAPAGFHDEELSALQGLTRLWAPRFLADSLPQRIAMVSAGPIGDVAPELTAGSEPSGAKLWTAVTPYIPARRHSGALVDRLSADIERELQVRGLPSIAEIELIDGQWLRFRRYRPMKERIGRSRPAYGVRLRLREPTLGPLALGQLSHFGLGLFVPERVE